MDLVYASARFVESEVRQLALRNRGLHHPGERFPRLVATVLHEDHVQSRSCAGYRPHRWRVVVTPDEPEEQALHQ